jgi:SAM-dependent methyltransferase
VWVLTQPDRSDMDRVRITPSDRGDARHYKRAFNFAFIWQLQHRPRRRIVECFMETMQPSETDLVLDLGTADLPEPPENIFEYYYPFKHRVVAAGTEDCRFLERQYPGLRFVRVTDGERLPFPDDTFDIGFSNATIEHVGSRERQAGFLRELVRVSRRAFVATPNRWFPFEVHTRLPFVHWLPAPAARAIIRRLGFEFYAREENLNLLSARGLVRLMRDGCHRTSLRRNYFFGLPSNLILVVEKSGPRTRG